MYSWSGVSVNTSQSKRKNLNDTVVWWLDCSQEIQIFWAQRENEELINIWDTSVSEEWATQK